MPFKFDNQAIRKFENLPGVERFPPGVGVGLQAHDSPRRILRALATVLMLLCSVSAQTAWRPGAYHDIIPGKTRKAAIIKAFGPPSETRKPSLTALAGQACCEELVY